MTTATQTEHEPTHDLCESCLFTTAVRSYRVESAEFPEWDARTILLCDPCCHAAAQHNGVTFP